MKKVLVFLTDGFADWEASYVTAELNKSWTGYEVQTVAIDKDPKVSMGGLKVLPDYSMDDVLPDFHMLIMPGGTTWREEKNQKIQKLVKECFDKNISVAAICDATTFLGMNGFLDHHKHTGNSLPYLKEGAPEYRGEEHYITTPSVRDNGLVTANGTAALEFSRNILLELNVGDEKGIQNWYEHFKKGSVPS
ncbi:type 1 glutamine amidotransferase family protein [Rossellomorea sp. YZS02]|uniref:type 1 glutamine amidotransferase family protein n=1 Tax=Rossellomorea sp. YZS02 TaxID=3097358 RepID=UPI002A124E5D|nr:type 1 glutamine amidotransferase family protein [Rossellomorea sp. YZS02]MDX8344567.1 type 1 glutamine amidotransferase family protein [Rossellomorea sp. YZS02]